MLDAPAAVALVILGQLLDRRERLRICAIADGMRGDLEIVHRGAAHHVEQLGVVDERQAALARHVRIIGLEQRPARAERAIEIELHAVEPQPVVIQPGGRAGAADRDHRLDPGGIGHDANAQPAFVPGAAIGLPIVDRRAHIGDAGNAECEQMVLRRDQRSIAIDRARWRH